MIAAPKLQINHKFIDRSVAKWLDLHFGDTSFNGRVFIGHRKRGGGVYTMSARSLTDLKQYIMLIHASQRIDYYITANTVSGTSRTMDGLFGLQNIVIDIDCHDTSADASELVQRFLWRAERDLWSSTPLPRPNSIVRTGRGVQLWWAIKPCHADCVFYYNRIKSGLMDHIDAMISEYSELDTLRVDRTASSNAVGYFRLPCTYNTAAKRYGSHQALHFERYSLQELGRVVSPLPRKSGAERKNRAEKPISLQACDVVVLRNHYTTGANRVMQLVKLRNLRNNEVGSETRNNLCFSVYNALRMAYDHEEAMDRLRAYNSGFKEPVTEAELEHTVCTAARKGGYKYTNAKLIEFLEITPEEQDAIGLHPFTGVYKPWGHTKPNATRDAIRKTLRSDRDSKVIEMHQEGFSQAETARILGISRNTVAKILQNQQSQNVIEIAQDKLLNYGSINDCLLGSKGASKGVAVSIEGGQSSPTLLNIADYWDTSPGDDG